MKIPQHTVIIPDGNRRWAKAKGRPKYFGHKAGAEAAKEILKTAMELKIPHLTLWTSSVSNLTKRSPAEVKFLFTIFGDYFEKLLNSRELYEHKVRIRALGKWEEMLPEKAKKPLRELIEKTKNYDKHHMTFLIAYSGVDEMEDAIQRIAKSKVQNPNYKIDKNTIKQNLWTKDLPPVDLVIRTGGEPHWSAGMMMWDVAEAQLYFTKTLWPDFKPDEFKKALAYYAQTERRYGR